MDIPAEEFYKNLPRKHLSAGALIFDDAGRFLLVKPIYKDAWGTPGGVVEANESPQAACIREVKEEIGIHFTPRRMLVVDFSKKYGFKGDSLHFLFTGDAFNESDLSKVKLQESEIESFDFFTLDNLPRVTDSTRQRLMRALESVKTGTTIFYEHETNIP